MVITASERFCSDYFRYSHCLSCVYPLRSFVSLMKLTESEKSDGKEIRMRALITRRRSKVKLLNRANAIDIFQVHHRNHQLSSSFVYTVIWLAFLTWGESERASEFMPFHRCIDSTRCVCSYIVYRCTDRYILINTASTHLDHKFMNAHRSHTHTERSSALSNTGSSSVCVCLFWSNYLAVESAEKKEKIALQIELTKAIHALRYVFKPWARNRNTRILTYSRSTSACLLTSLLDNNQYTVSSTIRTEVFQMHQRSDAINIFVWIIIHHCMRLIHIWEVEFSVV